MKTELISVISIDEYISKMSSCKNTQVPMDFDSSKHQILTRRCMLKILAAGGLTLLSSPVLLRRKADAFVPALIFAGIGVVALASYVWQVKKEMKGELALVNESYEDKAGNVNFQLHKPPECNLKMDLISSRNIDRDILYTMNVNNYPTEYFGQAEYTVGPRTINTYRFAGPVGVTPGDNRILTVGTEIDLKGTGGITLHV
jgi:hypothetical protein